MILNNGQITIEVSAHGAELQSLTCRGREYMWSGDAAYWNRHAPILFPAVGKPYRNTIRIDGRAYTMRQHGFARDSRFEAVDDCTLRMADADRADCYPYRHELKVQYRLEGSSVESVWTVTNLDRREMHFQIGAHPGFLLPDYRAADAVHGYVRYLDREGRAVSPTIRSALDDGNRIPLPQPTRIPAEMPLTGETFAHDALVFEQGQVAEAVLLDRRRQPVLGVRCPQAEAFGIWAPHKVGCPFVCLEPWCGICDPKGFDGDISRRTYSHALAPGESYRFGYTIVVY